MNPSPAIMWFCAVVSVFTSIGCRSGPKDHSAIQRCSFGQYGDAIRLSNGTAVAVIVPSISRIMYYGLQGGENMLWVNPPGQARNGPDDWLGIGGSRIWIWPESEWLLRTGRAWPPIPTYDEPSSVSMDADGKTIILRSPVHTAYGVRIIRRIRLEDRGCKLISETSLVPEPGMQTSPASPWEICKIPPPECGLARYSRSEAESPIFQWMSKEHDGLSVTELSKNMVEIRDIRADHVGKLGLNGDLVAAKRGKHLFIQISRTSKDGSYDHLARLQWYKSANKNPWQSSRELFCELEHTAAVTVSSNNVPPLVVEWSIQTLAHEQPTAEELIDAVNHAMPPGSSAIKQNR